MLNLKFQGHVFSVSEIKTHYKKGSETEISGYSQEVVVYCPEERDEFSTTTRRAQFWPFRVWSNKATDQKFVPLKLTAEILVKAHLEGQRFVKKEESIADKEMFFLSLPLAAWKVIKSTTARPVVEAKVSSGSSNVDELPF